MSDIRIERHGSVAVVVFDRPRTLNAWTITMRREIVEACGRLADDDDVEAVVFTGAGDRAFGAGQDLNEGGVTELSQIAEWVDGWREFFSCVRSFPKPTVSAINGVAAGSSLHFALMTDLRIGHDGTRMGQPEIRSGIASSIGPWILRETIGPLHAADLVLTGRMLPADECLRLGLVNRIVERGALLPASIRLAAELASHTKLAMRLTRARLVELSSESFQECFPIWREFLEKTLRARSAGHSPELERP